MAMQLTRETFIELRRMVGLPDPEAATPELLVEAIAEARDEKIVLVAQDLLDQLETDAAAGEEAAA